jgi:hypothetical protein
MEWNFDYCVNYRMVAIAEENTKKVFTWETDSCSDLLEELTKSNYDYFWEALRDIEKAEVLELFHGTLQHFGITTFVQEGLLYSNASMASVPNTVAKIPKRYKELFDLLLRKKSEIPVTSAAAGASAPPGASAESESESESQGSTLVIIDDDEQ